jgi:transposase
MPNSIDFTPRPARRYHSPEFKAQVVQQCVHDRGSVAGVALRNQINANIVHRWIREHEQRGRHSNPAFIPLPIDAPSELALPAPNNSVNSSGTSIKGSDHATIRIEIRRGQQYVTVDWPAQDGITCAAWLGEWLK